MQAATARGLPLVALESSVLAQGLLPPHNRTAAERMVGAIAARGAAAAITAVVHGTPTVGLEPAELERFLARDGVSKVSARDLSHVMLAGTDGATTVAGTLAICALAQLSVFATGGIGGVHQDAPFDESADLVELARTQAIVVCAGAKSILDLPATLERLETLGVSVVGYRTNELPGFFVAETGLGLSHSVQTAADIAALWRNHLAVGRPGALVVMQPLASEFALDKSVVEHATATALSEARIHNVRGGAVTPFLLAEIERLTEGRSVAANLALLEANATLAAEIATALTTP